MRLDGDLDREALWSGRCFLLPTESHPVRSAPELDYRWPFATPLSRHAHLAGERWSLCRQPSRTCFSSIAVLRDIEGNE